METQTKPGLNIPELEGISSEAISAFVAEAGETLHDLHSFILLRHGKVVAEGWWNPYTRELPHILFSLSKSFTSTAIGLLVDEGKLRVDTPVIAFFPEECPPYISENLAAMRVKDLLTMTTGQAEDTMAAFYNQPELSWVQSFLALPVEYKPGTHFVYNTGATYMLSAIVQKLSGSTLLDYLKPRLFVPLGITQPSWEASPQGISTGGFGLSLRTDEVARFGQLYLQKGVWQGRTIISQEWVEEATTGQVPNGTDPASDWAQGYGYQFWRCRNGAYRGDGAFGQFCLVMPEQEAVLAVTSGLDDMQAVLNLVWKHLLPAMQQATLPENPAAHQALVQKLGALEIGPVQGKGNQDSPVARQVSGKKYLFDENDRQLKSLSFDFDQGGTILTIENDLGETRVNCGQGSWLKGQSTLDGYGERKIAASGAWLAAETYQARIYYLTPVLDPEPPLNSARNSPFSLTLTCRFSDDEVKVEYKLAQSFLPVKESRKTGRSLQG